jgi:hypothetical protein
LADFNSMTWFERTGSGVRLHVRVTPRASHEGLQGIETDAAGRARLKLRVAAPPAEGAANARVISLLAKAIGRPVSAFRLAGGARSRNKTVEIGGDPAELAAKLASLTGGGP